MYRSSCSNLCRSLSTYCFIKNAADCSSVSALCMSTSAVNMSGADVTSPTNRITTDAAMATSRKSDDAMLLKTEGSVCFTCWSKASLVDCDIRQLSLYIQQCIYYYFATGRAAKCCDEYVCLSVCLSAHITREWMGLKTTGHCRTDHRTPEIA